MRWGIIMNEVEATSFVATEKLSDPSESEACNLVSYNSVAAIREPFLAVQSYSRTRHAGDPPNTQISLRIPASWIVRLREQAIRAAGQEDRTISAQEIVRRILADALAKPF